MGPRVALDTNVLVAAFLAPSGLGRRVLTLALLGEYEPIITTEVLAELDRHCRRGIKGIVPTERQIGLFREALHPLLEQMELLPGPIGRAASEGHHTIVLDTGFKIRAHPGGATGKHTVAVGNNECLMRDMGDAHLLAATICYRCRYLCSWNSRDFPPGMSIAGIEMITPEDLLERLETGPDS